MTYDEVVRRLFPRLTGGIRWGLDRTRRLLAAVGDPHQSFRSIHIGGTNGKGSVSATMASVLLQSRRRVGLYTSPHLCTFRERIQVAGEPVGEAAVVAAAERLWPALEREEASFFEATTALAFLIFAEAGVEVAVVEVGLGGRLDATNVIVPEVTVLTNVSRDHTDQLGDTLVAIAAEKAGIIKPGVPVVTGARDAEVQGIFRARAAEVGAPYHELAEGDVRGVEVTPTGTRCSVRTGTWGELELRTPLVGEHQAWNVGLAVRALELLPAELRPERGEVVRGVAGVRWPGRLQRERLGGQEWIFDAAHNPAGIAVLCAALAELRVARPVVAVVGILGDKEWGEMLRRLQGCIDYLILTQPPTAPPGRSWDPGAALAAAGGVPGEVVLDFGGALEAARERAGEGTVVVTGSFHTVGDALSILGLAPYGVDPTLPAKVAGI